MLSKKTNNATNKNKLNERFPNENLFKSDNKYHINKNLQFDSTIENQNCFLDIFRQKLPLIKFSILLIFAKFCIYFSIKNFWLFSLTLIQISCFAILIYIVKNLETVEISSNHAELERQFQHMRKVLELLSNIYVYMRLEYKIQINESTALTKDMALYHFFYSNFFNYLTNRKTSQALFWLFVKGYVLLFFTSRSDLGLFSRCLRNLFTYDFVLIICLIFLFLFLEFIKNRMIVEIWGLYDSFKRSFHIFKRCLYDDFPNPIFIISRKQYEQVLYKNKAADKLHEKICASKTQLKNNSTGLNNPTNATGINSNPNAPGVNNNNATSSNTMAASGINKRTFGNLNNGGIAGGSLGKKSTLASRKINTTNNNLNNFSFSNLLEKEFEELFNIQIDKCIANKKKFFYFPFPLYEKAKTNLKYKESMRNITFFEGDLECFEWFKVIVSPCSFKSQESILLQMLKEDCFFKEDFMTNFFTNLNYEFNVLIENVDKICDNIVEADFFFERREKLQIISKLNRENTSNMAKETISRNLGERLNDLNRDRGDIIRSAQRLKTFNFGTDNNKAKITKDLLIDLHNVQYPYLDFSVWFFFKNNSSSLYDSFLTLKIYNQINSNKFFKPNYKISNFSNLIRYFDDLFFTVSQKNGININSNLQGNQVNASFCNASGNSGNYISNCSEEEYFVVYDYLRVVIYNLYLFNLNNVTETSKPRELIVNYIIEKTKNSENKEYDLCLRINLSMENESPIIDFNDLNLLLQKLNPIKNPKNERAFIKHVDPRILLVYLISKIYYQTEFSCEREENVNKMSVGILLQSKDFVKKQENLKQAVASTTSSGNNNSGFNRSSSQILINNVSNNGIVYGNHSAAQPNKIIEKVFEEPKYHISEPYYVKLLNKTYGYQIEYKPRYKLLNCKYQTSHSDEIIDEIVSNVTSEDDDDDDIFGNYDFCHNQDFQLNYLNSDMLNARQYFAMANHFDNEAFEKFLNIDSTELKINKIIDKSQNLKILPIFKKDPELQQETWDYGSLKSNVNYFYPPRFLIVEDNVIGRFNLIEILKKQNLNCLIDVAAYGRESIQKFKYFLNKGFLYDIVFMDINLPDMLGSEATRIMRSYEKEYSNKKSIIIAVSVEGKNNVGENDLFNDYFEKPIKANKFTECITKHFRINRPNLMSKDPKEEKAK